MHQAMHLHLALEAAQARRHAAEAGLEAVGTGVVLLSRDGRTLFANRAARRLFDAGRLRLSGGRLAAPVPADDAALRRVIAAALDGTGSALAAVADLRDLRVRAIPVAEPGLAVDEAVAAVVLLHDKALPVLDPAPLLALGLTPSEASLAVAVAAGETLEAYAARTGRALGTVRAQLRAVFGKTDTHRQSELVLLVMRTAGGE
jgi:DNA-binding CsgD family transcriptional regulator